MKNLKLLVILFLAVGGISIIAVATWREHRAQQKILSLEAALSAATAKDNPDRLSNHQRDIWLANLEWCESRGIPEAINPFDSDGTPSFGAFQFKPSTFKYYQEKYQLAGSLMDYAAQLDILKRMIDDPEVKFDKEFPACIKKIGFPPKKF